MKKTVSIIIALIVTTVPFSVAFADRTQSTWLIDPGNTYTFLANPLNVLISGINKYLNFGTFSGTTGYGFRDNGGVMEFKNSGGSWTGVGTGGSGTNFFTQSGTTISQNTGSIVSVGSITATSTTANNIISGPIQVKAAISNHIPSDFPTTDYNLFDMSTDGQVFLNAGNDSLIGSETFMTLSDDCPTNHLGGCWSVVSDDDTASISVNINQLGMTNISGIANTTLTLGSSNNDQVNPITIIADSSKGMVAGSPVGREFDIKSEENDAGGKGGDLRLFGGTTQTAGQKMGNVLIGTSTTPFFLGIATDTPGTMLSMGSTSANFINFDVYATSTMSKGANLLSGCWAIKGVCGGGGSGTLTAVTGTYPIASSGGTTPNITFIGLSTSTAAVVGNIPYFSGANTFANIATSSETCSAPLSCTTYNVIGTGGGAITLGTVGVANGGTGQTAFGQGWLNSNGSTITSSTSPTVNYITATSTTQTSNFQFLSIASSSPMGTFKFTVGSDFNMASGTGMYTNGSASIRDFPQSQTFYAGGAGPTGLGGAVPLGDIAIGANSFISAIGGANNSMCLGASSCRNVTTGSTLMAIGVSALGRATTDSQSTAIGSSAMSNEAGGADDIGIGFNSLSWNQSSGSGALNGDIAIGSYAGFSLNNTNSNYNVFIGLQSGFALTNSQHDVFLGTLAGYSDGTVNTLITGNNMSCIGYECQVTASNSGVLGGLGVNQQLWGIGTSSPYATFSIQSNSSTGDAFVIATSTGNAIAGVDNDGHRFTSGPAPIISSCGTGTGTVVGDDQSGTITTATAATACTMTFAKAYQKAPTCTVTDNSLVGFADISSVSVSAVTFGISSALTGGNLYYSCGYHR